MFKAMKIVCLVLLAAAICLIIGAPFSDNFIGCLCIGLLFILLAYNFDKEFGKCPRCDTRIQFYRINLKKCPYCGLDLVKGKDENQLKADEEQKELEKQEKLRLREEKKKH